MFIFNQDIQSDASKIQRNNLRKHGSVARPAVVLISLQI